MSLETVRGQIDRIDDRLLRLLERRMELAERTAAFKPAVRDAGRESEIVFRLQGRAAASGRLSAAFIAALYGLIFAESRKAQKEDRP